MKKSPTASARAYGIRNYGVFWFTSMTPIARKQLERAYVAGFRAAKNRRGK